MPWRVYTQLPNKKFWVGPDWPDEVSQKTRDAATANGWSPADWAACRNACTHEDLEAWFDDLPVLAVPVPATVIAEMVERADQGADNSPPTRALDMLDGLAGGAPPCVAWLIAHDYKGHGTVAQNWELAQQLGLSGVQFAGWWHTKLVRVNKGRFHVGHRADIVGRRIKPWIEALGPNAYLWSLAGYRIGAAKTEAKAGITTEDDLKDVIKDEGVTLPAKLNEHCAPELNPDPDRVAAMAEDEGWVVREQDFERVWTKAGWPPDIPERTVAAAASAGWTDRDWVRLHTAASRHYLRDWLWEMPFFPAPLDPDLVLGLINIQPWSSYSRDALDAIAGRVPAQFATVYARRLKAGSFFRLSAVGLIRAGWKLAQDLGLGEQEGTGWLLTGFLDPSARVTSSALVRASDRIDPWRKFGPAAYLWVLAGVGRREAAKTAKQPGWDEATLRVMVALNGVTLPSGV